MVQQLITWLSIQRHLVKVFSLEAQVNKRPIFIFILQPHLRHHGLLCTGIGDPMRHSCNSAVTPLSRLKA
jgi:hypothetical protein